jgi:membrane protein DedA with SNARE-associated domain
MEQRPRSSVGLEVDACAPAAPGHADGLATRRELTSRLGARLAADRQLSASGRRRRRPRFVPPRKATSRPGGHHGTARDGLLSLSGWAALAALFTLPALETPAFLGLVLPGELALLLGGVLAHQDRIPWPAPWPSGSLGPWPATRPATGSATAGATPAQLTLGRRVGPARLHTVKGLLLRGGARALVVGRCTAGARVLLPGLGRHARARYRVFVLWTGVAAMVWAVAHVLLGYAAGAGWRHAHHLSGPAGIALAVAVVVAAAVAWLVHGPARRHEDEPARSTSRSGSRSDPAARAGVPGPHREPGELDRVCDCYGPVTRGES